MVPKLVRVLRRHGDKGREMQLVSFSSYVEAAEKLITENPLNYNRVGFVSSEDQSVIDEAGSLTRLDTGPLGHYALLFPSLSSSLWPSVVSWSGSAVPMVVANDGRRERCVMLRRYGS